MPNPKPSDDLPPDLRIKSAHKVLFLHVRIEIPGPNLDYPGVALAGSEFLFLHDTLRVYVYNVIKIFSHISTGKL